MQNVFVLCLAVNCLYAGLGSHCCFVVIFGYNGMLVFIQQLILLNLRDTIVFFWFSLWVSANGFFEGASLVDLNRVCQALQSWRLGVILLFLELPLSFIFVLFCNILSSLYLFSEKKSFVC